MSGAAVFRRDPVRPRAYAVCVNDVTIGWVWRTTAGAVSGAASGSYGAWRLVWAWMQCGESKPQGSNERRSEAAAFLVRAHHDAEAARGRVRPAIDPRLELVEDEEGVMESCFRAAHSVALDLDGCASGAVAELVDVAVARIVAAGLELEAGMDRGELGAAARGWVGGLDRGSLARLLGVVVARPRYDLRPVAGVIVTMVQARRS